MAWILASAVALTLMVAVIVFAPRRPGHAADAKDTRKLILGLSGFNLILGSMLIGFGLLWLFAPRVAQAAGLVQATPTDQYASLAAAISAGLGSIGAAYAVGATGSAAIGVIAEKPEAFGRVLIFVGLAEGIAIYGLIIAFMILTR
jgi:V/A-type H+/Na+-transporting ATPase subunit K